MQVMNKRPYAVDIVATGQRVEGGETVEVSDDVGETLAEQEDAWAVVGSAGRPSIKQVRSDVGSDPEKARQALAVEHASDDPRKSLISHLEEIVAADEEQS